MKTIILAMIFLAMAVTAGADKNDVSEAFHVNPEDAAAPALKVQSLLSLPEFRTGKDIAFCPKNKDCLFLYDLLIKLREFVRDNDLEAWATFDMSDSVYRPAPSRTQLLEQEIKKSQARLERLKRETALRKDIEAIISVMENK